MMKEKKNKIIILIIIGMIAIIIGVTIGVLKNKTQNINIVGNWSPYKAFYNNEEVSLSDIYGTGLNYGGYLTFNSDNTYKELIGIYSDEEVQRFTGTYKQKDNKILLTAKDDHQTTYEIIKESNKTIIKKTNSSDIIIYFEQANEK